MSEKNTTSEEVQLVVKKNINHEGANGEDHGDDHGHGHGSPSAFSIGLSGIINGVLMFAFCCVYAQVIVSNHHDLAKFQGVVVGTQTVSAMITGFITTKWSQVSATIGGPDVNPAVFHGAMASIIVAMNPPPEAASSPGYVDTAEDEVRQTRVLATVLFVLPLCTFIQGLLFYLLGRFRLSRVMQYMPASVLAGFLACVGYKVLGKAVTAATGLHYTTKVPMSDHDQHEMTDIFGTWDKGWRLLLPALPIGIPLYFLKRAHIKPTVVMPIFLFVPVILFFVITAAVGTSIEATREEQWLFPYQENEDFWKQWEFLKFSEIDWNSVGSAMVQVAPMLLITTIDCLLKLAGTEKNLEVDIDYNEELMLWGKTNFVNMLFVGSTGYGQLKFNKLNYGITHSVTSRAAGYVNATILAVFFFAGEHLINYLPRFFIGGLVVFAGFGFLVENLWDVRQHMSKWELFIVYTIFIVNVCSSLLIAIFVGILLALLLFAMQYATVNDVKSVVPGDAVDSGVIRMTQQDKVLSYLGRRVVVVHLHHYIFFGSVTSIQDVLMPIVSGEEDIESHKQLKYLIVDFEFCDGMDAAGASFFLKLCRKARNCTKIQILWSGLADRDAQIMKDEGLIDESNGFKSFPKLDTAMIFVEDQLLDYAAAVRSKWMMFPSFKKKLTEATLLSIHNLFAHILETVQGPGHISYAKLWKYCTVREVEPNTVVCDSQKFTPVLFLVQSGRVTAYNTLSNGDKRRIYTSTTGSFFNEDTLFGQMDSSVTFISDTDAESRLIVLEKSNWECMCEEEPLLSQRILSAVLRHQRTRLRKLENASLATERWEEFSKERRNELMERIHLKTDQKVEANVKSAAKALTTNPFVNRTNAEKQDIQDKSTLQASNTVLWFELVSATQEGNLERVKHILQNNVDVNFKDYDSRTALHIAAADNQVAIAGLLLSNGARITVPDRWNVTPLDAAKENGHQQVVDLFEQHMQATHLAKKISQLLLMLITYAGKGDVEKVQECISKGIDVNLPDYDDRRALHIAASEGKVDVVKALISAKANVHVKDRWSYTPLWDAKQNQHATVVQLLEAAAAKPFQEEPKSPVSVTAECVLQEFDRDYVIFFDLCNAINERNHGLVNSLISDGADVNGADYDRRTALHIACSVGDLDCVKTLLKNGAHLSALDRWSRSPLDDAKEGGYSQIVEALIEHVGDIPSSEDSQILMLPPYRRTQFSETYRTFAQSNKAPFTPQSVQKLLLSVGFWMENDELSQAFDTFKVDLASGLTENQFFELVCFNLFASFSDLERSELEELFESLAKRRAGQENKVIYLDDLSDNVARRVKCSLDDLRRQFHDFSTSGLYLDKRQFLGLASHMIKNHQTDTKLQLDFACLVAGGDNMVISADNLVTTSAKYGTPVTEAEANEMVCLASAGGTTVTYNQFQDLVSAVYDNSKLLFYDHTKKVAVDVLHGTLN